MAGLANLPRQQGHAEERSERIPEIQVQAGGDPEPVLFYFLRHGTGLNLDPSGVLRDNLRPVSGFVRHPRWLLRLHEPCGPAGRGIVQRQDRAEEKLAHPANRHGYGDVLP